jgi:hypothetical protein
MLATLLFSSAALAQTAVPPSAGDGLTTATAYQITELGNLVWLGEQAGSQTVGMYYTMMNDIDASVTATWPGGFLPICAGRISDPDITSFRGVFDGNGHKIVGLTINLPPQPGNPNSTSEYVGLFGWLGWGGVIKDLGLQGGTVLGTVAGALVGRERDGTGTILRCWASGTVTGQGYYSTFLDLWMRSFAGGLVGGNDGGEIKDSYATGAVMGDTAGGLAGIDSGALTNCYATGLTNGASGLTVGGLVGQGSSPVSCYWDTETTGQSTSAGGTGKTTAEMEQQATFVGWDFAIVWAIAPGINNGYPYLRALGAAATGPNEPTAPTPADRATGQALDVALTWQNGGGASSYDVYLDTANPPMTRVAASQTETSYTPPSSLGYATTYFWRIDATNAVGTTPGEVWSFTTLAPPNRATAPSPADGATGQAADVALSWQNGGGATSYDVYLDTANPPATQVATAQTETSYAPPASLAYGTTYFWRIDATNAAGSAAGDVWSFRTVPAPVVPGHFLSQSVRSSHSEKWDAKDARVVGKDAYSFSGKMQLTTGSLASLSNATTLTLVLGDDVTSGAACEVFKRSLSAATKSTLAGHPTAKKPKDPTRGGSVTFVELQPNSTKKARVVSIKWTKTGLLTATVLGTPPPASWDAANPADPAEHRVVQNVADLCDAVKWPAGAAAGVAVPALVEITGVFADADTVTCAGKKGVRSSDGADLVGWSVSGK